MNWGHPDRGKVLLFAGDLLLTAAAASFANGIDPATHGGTVQRACEIASFMLVFSSCLYIFDLYDVRALNGARTFARLLAATILGVCTLSFFLILSPWRWFSLAGMAVSGPLVFMGSLGLRRFYKHNWSRFHNRRGVVMIGTGQDATCLHNVMESKNCPYEFLGLLRTGAPPGTQPSIVISRIEEPLFAVAGAATGGQHQAASTTTVSAILADLSQNPAAKNSAIESFGFTDFGLPAPLDLERLVLTRGVDTIVVRPDLAMPELAEVLTRLRFQGVRIATLPDLCSQILEKLPLETLSDTWFSFATGFNLLHARIFRKVKRLLDILLACVGLILTLPISLLVAIVLKVESPGPVLFRQWRVGWREKPFLLLKFRSMRLDAESDGKPQWATPRDPRVTFVGRILRRLHIDEIPQMMNVLLGEMSFIGPRPERPVFVGQLKALVPFYYLRHYIPPGITGWAQVNYPYGDCVEDAKMKLQYDLFYVRYASITLDLRILLRTVRAVLFRTGSR